MLINQRSRRQFAGFGAPPPLTSSTDIVLAQKALRAIGFDVYSGTPSGIYDAKTSAAVLEFRGAVGLPVIDQIDDDFMARLYDELDVVGTGNLPPNPGGSGGRTDDIGISGKAGAAVGFGLLFLLLFASRSKKRRK